jgi:pimeloyl-ACP methyl ester carboxylesterase
MTKKAKQLIRFLRRRAKTLTLAAVTLLGAYGAVLYGGAPHLQNDYPASPLLPSQSCAVSIQNEFAKRAGAVKAPTVEPQATKAIPVIVIPGFLLDDAFMAPLVDDLKKQGFAAEGWGAGRNAGAEQKQVALFLAQLKSVYDANGQEPVFLIGYSAGGIHAREAARLYPEMVRGVVTIATPFNIKTADGKLDPAVVAIRALYGAEKSPTDKPPPVPTSSIFSFDDVAFSWRGALSQLDGGRAENIPMQGGHISLVFRRDVLALLSDRINQHPSTWQALSAQICGLGNKPKI